MEGEITLKDKPFIFRDTQVKAYKYGDTVEMTTSHGKHSNPIKKLNSDEFLDLRTGEIRLYNKQAVNRGDNLKAVKRTFVKLRRLVGNNFFGGSTELWGRNDEGIAGQMTGNIKFNYSTESKMKFNGNQAVKL